MNDTINNTADTKYAYLKEYLRGLGNAAVAFSGGVDSSFLLRAAQEALGENVIAVTAASAFVPESELDDAVRFCRGIGAAHEIFRADVLGNDEIRANPPDRCYICKRRLFGNIIGIARERGILNVIEGSNTDDQSDYRPGMRAVKELGVKSPLLEAGLSKAEIRLLSRKLGLPTWNKPSFACLASRFECGEELTAEKLYAVEKAERFLSDQGFRQMRVRFHGGLARIELEPDDIPRAVQPDMRGSICEMLGKLGFRYVTLDMAGYRTGSMNPETESR